MTTSKRDLIARFPGSRKELWALLGYPAAPEPEPPTLGRRWRRGWKLLKRAKKQTVDKPKPAEADEQDDKDPRLDDRELRDLEAEAVRDATKDTDQEAPPSHRPDVGFQIEGIEASKPVQKEVERYLTDHPPGEDKYIRAGLRLQVGIMALKVKLASAKVPYNPVTAEDQEALFEAHDIKPKVTGRWLPRRIRYFGPFNIPVAIRRVAGQMVAAPKRVHRLLGLTWKPDLSKPLPPPAPKSQTEQYMKFIYSLVWKFLRARALPNDLFEEALAEAVAISIKKEPDWQPERFAFSTFIAPWIDGELRAWLKRELRRGTHVAKSDPEYKTLRIHHTGHEIPGGELADSDEASQDQVSATMEGLGAESEGAAEPMTSSELTEHLALTARYGSDVLEEVRKVLSERDAKIFERVTLEERSARSVAADPDIRLSEGRISQLLGENGRITLAVKKIFNREPER